MFEPLKGSSRPIRDGIERVPRAGPGWHYAYRTACPRCGTVRETRRNERRLCADCRSTMSKAEIEVWNDDAKAS